MAGRLLRELTIRQLRALAAVQKHRSVTAAAKQLHLTQPAVTLQLRNLQALAGLPLIQRTGDGMLLTDAGREVLALADRIEAAIADCETTLEMMAGKTAGRISIGAVSTAKYFVPFMISGFSKLSSEHRRHALDRKPAGDRHGAARLRSRFRDHGPPTGRHRHGRSPDRRSSPCHHRADRASPGAKIPHRAERARQRDLPDARARVGNARPDGATVRNRRHSPEDRHGDEQQRDHQAGGDRRFGHCLHFRAHGGDRTRRTAAGHARRRWPSRSSGNGSCSPARTRCCCRRRRRCSISSAPGASSFSRACTAGCASPGHRSAASAADASCGARIRVAPRSPSPLRYRYVEHSGEAIFRYGMAEREFAISRRDAPEPCLNDPPPRMRGRRERRVPSAPAARVQKNAHGSHHRYSGISRRSLRNGFTAYAALSLATNSSCHHRRRIEWRSSPVEPISPPPT